MQQNLFFFIVTNRKHVQFISNETRLRQKKDENLSQLRSFVSVTIHNISATFNKKYSKIPGLELNLKLIHLARRNKLIRVFDSRVYPTALKRQLLSEGITLLTTIPSMLQIKMHLKQSQIY